MDDPRSSEGPSQAQRIMQLLTQSGYQLVLAESCTAGQAAAWIGSQPGVSAHLCGSAVVYQEETKQQWLGVSSQTLADLGAVSHQVADQMAVGALKRTAQATLAAAITGHLGPDAPANLDGVLELAIAIRPQPGERIVSAGHRVTLPAADRQTRQQLAAQRLLALVERTLLACQAHKELDVDPDGRHLLPGLESEAETGSDALVFPGAFAPLHEGHREMIVAAQKGLDRQAVLELSIDNVDKSPLSAIGLVQRVVPLADYPVWVTRAATFAEKSARFPGATFIVGADTVARIGDLRYYDGDEDRMQHALADLASAGTELLVFGRTMSDDYQTGQETENARFLQLDQLDLPDSLRQRCRQVDEAEFRRDVSSRDLGPEAG